MFNQNSISLIDPEDASYPNIHVIGVGATGSYVALALGTLGFNSKLHVYDMDSIELKNVGNQAFSIEHVGMQKVEAVKKLLQKKTGQFFSGSVNSIEINNSMSQYMDGIVLLLVDSISARKNIFEGLLKSKTELVIETGIDVFSNEIRVCDMSDSEAVANMKSLFDSRQEDSPSKSRWGVSACGSPNNAVMSSMITAGLVVSTIATYLLGLEINSEVLLGYEGSPMLLTSNSKIKRKQGESNGAQGNQRD